MYISSFGIPIISKIEGGDVEDLKKSIAGKLSNIKLSQFPSLQKENAPFQRQLSYGANK